MGFVRFFDLFDFDTNGDVCATKLCDENKARSNYLYLICKYNQRILKAKKKETPEFFIEPLTKVLEAVEQGANYKKARVGIAKYCEPEVAEILTKNSSDRLAIMAINELTSRYVRSIDFEKKMRNSQFGANPTYATHVLCVLAGKVDSDIERNIENVDDPSVKKNVFKNIVTTNCIMCDMQKLAHEEITVEDLFCKAN